MDKCSEMNNWNHLCTPEYVVITALISGMGLRASILVLVIIMYIYRPTY